MTEPIATWNAETQLWETPQADLFSEQSAPYSATFPPSGSMRNGSLFPPPRSAPPTAANASSSSPTLLHTPAARDGKGLSPHPAFTSLVNDLLVGEGVLLPTPAASHANDGGARPGVGDQTRLPNAIRSTLLPTPTATPYGSNQSPSAGAAVRPSLDGIAGPSRTPGRSDADNAKAGRNLADVLLPTPSASDGIGGGPNNPENQLAQGHHVQLIDLGMLQPDVVRNKYAAAIERWETITRPAPVPTEPNSKGNPRINPEFSEWMMGWPAGWVTALLGKGVTRNAALTIIGNGVVPQQAVHAVQLLIDRVFPARTANQIGSIR